MRGRPEAEERPRCVQPPFPPAPQGQAVRAVAETGVQGRWRPVVLAVKYFPFQAFP